MTLKQLLKVLPHYQKFSIIEFCKNPNDFTPKYITDKPLEEIEHYKVISIVAYNDVMTIEVKNNEKN